jgi:hypothetical protein
MSRFISFAGGTNQRNGSADFPIPKNILLQTIAHLPVICVPNTWNAQLFPFPLTCNSMQTHTLRRNIMLQRTTKGLQRYEYSRAIPVSDAEADATHSLQVEWQRA